MASNPNYINALTKVFNAPGALFNGNPATPIKYLKRIPQQRPDCPTDLVPDGSQIRKNFDNFTPNPSVTTVASPPPVVRRRHLVGNFSGIRAARILHQHIIDFWNDAEIYAILNDPPPAVYSQDQLTQMYADFLLFNYLPDTMTPSFDDFVAIVQPTGNFNLALGIDQAVPELVTTDTVQPSVTALPPPVPFGESLTPFCQLISMRTTR